MGLRLERRFFRRTIRTTAAVVVALAMLGTGCGDGGSDTEATATPVAVPLDGTDPPSASDGNVGSTSDEPTTDDPATDDPTTDTDTDTDDATTLPGEPWEGFVRAGDVLAVAGVAHDDTLNVRAAPGTDREVVASAAPTADDLVATGRARQLPRSFWYEVEIDGVTGWVSVAFLAHVAGTDDATAEFLDGDPPPRAETLQQLGELVAAAFASEEPRSSVVQSVAPTVGDVGEVTYDVIGIGDDSLMGYRLHVFATPDDSGEGFELRTIERTTFCSRGSDGELCV